MEERKEMKKTTEKKKIVGTRGRTFQGVVIKNFDKRIVLELERTVYVPKYERFSKKKTRLHARKPEGMEISVGDYVKVRECRPLSKIIHFMAVEVVKKVQENAGGSKK